MTVTARSLLLVALPLLLAAPAHADEARGKLLYENHCQVCHESGVHVRENRKVTDRGGIMAMVVRFSQHLQLEWAAEEMVDVVDYLDAEYYHTGKSTL